MQLIEGVLTEREDITGEEFENLFTTGNLTGTKIELSEENPQE